MKLCLYLILLHCNMFYTTNSLITSKYYNHQYKRGLKFCMEAWLNFVWMHGINGESAWSASFLWKKLTQNSITSLKMPYSTCSFQGAPGKKNAQKKLNKSVHRNYIWVSIGQKWPELQTKSKVSITLMIKYCAHKAITTRASWHCTHLGRMICITMSQINGLP